MKRPTWIAIVAGCPIALALTLPPLPIFSDFNADTPSLPPSTGGPDQPTVVSVPSGGSVLVQASALGLNDQPVVLSDNNGEYVTVDWHFPQVVDQVVRTEVTVSVDQLLDAYFFQTANSANAVLARLHLRPNGDITPYFQATVLGTYSPNTPFRLRIDTDIVAYSYSATIDDELNGFDDDPTFPGLPFLNSGLTDCGQVLASINSFSSGPVAIGYDDVSIGPPASDPGTAYCFGDGSGTACPCGNSGGADEGCANSTGSGATLAAAGSASVGSDDLEFSATGLLPGQPALLFVGELALNNGDGVVFGDGLRCAGMNVVRLGVELPDGGGTASWGPGLGATGGWADGETRTFQGWYRDPSGGPCGTGFNLTNGLEVAFTP